MRPFVFSYAHSDDDPYLDEFFAELDKRVRLLTGIKVGGFRDIKALRAGEEWSKELADELAVSPALVCMYSPAYFRSEVCSQELAVFTARRRKTMDERPGRRPANIIPILWLPCDEIPYSLPDFQYEKPPAHSEDADYTWRLRDLQDVAGFNAVAQAVAVRVKEAQRLPLAKLDHVPTLGGMPSAFEPSRLPADFDADDGANGPLCATFVAPAAPAWRDWPFPDEEAMPARPLSKRLLHISAAVARGRDLEARQLTIDPGSDPLPKMKAARERNNRLVLVLTVAHLKDGALVDRLKALDSEGPETLSTLVARDGGTAEAEARRRVAEAFPRMSQRQPPYFHSDLDDAAKFAKAVASSLDHLESAVLNHAKGVPELALPTSFASLPSVRSPGERGAA